MVPTPPPAPEPEAAAVAEPEATPEPAPEAAAVGERDTTAKACTQPTNPQGCYVHENQKTARLWWCPGSRRVPAAVLRRIRSPAAARRRWSRRARSASRRALQARRCDGWAWIVV